MATDNQPCVPEDDAVDPALPAAFIPVTCVVLGCLLRVSLLPFLICDADFECVPIVPLCLDTLCCPLQTSPKVNQFCENDYMFLNQC